MIQMQDALMVHVLSLDVQTLLLTTTIHQQVVMMVLVFILGVMIRQHVIMTLKLSFKRVVVLIVVLSFLQRIFFV